MPKLSGEAYRRIRLCIDSYHSGVWKGCWYHPGLRDGNRFESLVQFLTEAETLFDSIKFPQSYTAKRVFVPLPDAGSGGGAGLNQQRGQQGTFLIRLLFRQNTSWQGSITWLEGGGEQTFRSVLELILLIDSALGGCGEGLE